MIARTTVGVSPQESYDDDACLRAVCDQLHLRPAEVSDMRLRRRSLDARGRGVTRLLTFDVYVGERAPDEWLDLPGYPDVRQADPVVVVGAGPAGLFAALRLIELRRRPIVVERGRDVSQRKKDVALLCRNQGLDPESNYAFGEGGAGAFSDGKLYTRSTKRGNVRKILETLCWHGADQDILLDAHPHIGSDKLPGVVKAMRGTIEGSGGAVLFGARVSDLLTDRGRATGVLLADGQRVEGRGVILATGHSAADTYQMLRRRGIALEAKGWAMGVRVEHPQELIDETQYHSPEGRGEWLPAATYALTAQVAGRGVYSFCMCPGGFIVPATTEWGLQVVNGMSPAARCSPWANAGIVVEVRPDDVPGQGPLAGLDYQRHLEQLAWANGGHGAQAPAQALADFVDGRLSYDLPDTSYLPGVVSSPLHFWLPAHLADRLREGFRLFDKRLRGFVSNEALVLGVESRTSSPVRVTRHEDTLQSVSLPGLYPCGEGAGYAGGIVSSAIDGELCAEALCATL